MPHPDRARAPSRAASSARPSPAASRARQPDRAVRLPGAIDRACVDAIVERCREALASGVTDIDCADLVDPRLPTIEVIALLALAARRDRRRLRLEHAGPDLLELLELCGLSATIDVDDVEGR